jgi:hypothetical protein
MSFMFPVLSRTCPYGLVAMSELGRAAGVATSVIDGLVTLTSTMLRRDFRSEGRNLAQLGRAGKTVSERSVDRGNGTDWLIRQRYRSLGEVWVNDEELAVSSSSPLRQRLSMTARGCAT